MADLKYSVQIETANAARSLSSLTGSIRNVGAALGGAFALQGFNKVASQIDNLRRTLETLYKSAGAGSQVFQEVASLANNLGVDVNALAEATIKLKNAGIDPTTSRLKFFADVAKSSTDELGTLVSITDLYARTVAGGLGLEELERLQDRGIPVYRILQEELKKTRGQLAEYGQTAEGAERIRAALERGLTKEIGGSAEKNIGSLSSSLTKLSNTFKIAVDDLGRGGLNEIIIGLADTIGNFVQNNRELIVQIGQTMANAFKVFLENLDLVIIAGKIFFTVWAAKKVADLALAFVTLGKAIGKTPIAIIAIGAAALAQQLGLLDDVIKKVSDAFSDPETETFAKGIKDLNGEVNNFAGSKGVKILKEGVLGEAPKGNLITEQFRKFKTETESVANAFALANKEQRENIELQTNLIGATSEYSAILTAQNELSQKSRSEIAKLREEKAKLSAAELEEGRGGVIDEVIKKIEEQTRKDQEATQAAIEANQARQRGRQLELFAIQNQINLQDELMRIQDDIAKSSMSEIEQKYYDIERAAERSALAAIRAEEARIGRPLNSEEVKRYYDEAAKGTDRVKQKTKELYDNSRTFSTGWGRAFREYADNATNAAKQAERIFAKTTQGIEDMLVGFVKTGKFEWKSFVADMAETLLRSQIQQTIAKTFSGDGLFGAIGSLFGGGGGGGGQPRGQSVSTPLFVQDVSGGLGGGTGGLMGGGGLMSGGGIGGGSGGLGSIGSTIGNIFSGVKGGIGSIGSTIGKVASGIGSIFTGGGSSGGGGLLSSIGKGVSSLFGGFFANGGTIPAGKFGIVGERGPEFIGGPANITPMAGNVTYNINAVDAASFKQLVAADPGFIHAVAMQGGRAMPTRR
jgi:lambda family phage tail tape measure protein